ncbi:MAG: NUDIX domain-containing protein [Pseudomonadota bacterium]
MPNSVECACGLPIKDGKVLLGLRSANRKAYPNVWDVFGGHIKEGESTEDALLRELREELDITPTDYRFLTTLLDPCPEKHGHARYHLFKVTAWSGPGPRLCGAEHSEMRWCTCQEAMTMDLAIPAYKEILRACAI